MKKPLSGDPQSQDMYERAAQINAEEERNGTLAKEHPEGEMQVVFYGKKPTSSAEAERRLFAEASAELKREGKLLPDTLEGLNSHFGKKGLRIYEKLSHEQLMQRIDEGASLEEINEHISHTGWRIEEKPAGKKSKDKERMTDTQHVSTQQATNSVMTEILLFLLGGLFILFKFAVGIAVLGLWIVGILSVIGGEWSAALSYILGGILLSIVARLLFTE